MTAAGAAQHARTLEPPSHDERPPVLVQRHGAERIASALFLAPAVIFLLVTSVYPLLYSFWLGLHSWNMTIPRSKPVWVGMRNYEQLLENSAFRNSLEVTLKFVLVAVAVEMLLGMGLALIATSNIRAMGVVRTVMLFPLMIAPVVAGVLWRTLYHSSYGVVNYVLGFVGIGPQEWLGSPKQALPAVITVEIWQNLPVVAFVLAAGIQSLPVDLYKAAEVDGAIAGRSSSASPCRSSGLPCWRARCWPSRCRSTSSSSPISPPVRGSPPPRCRCRSTP